jgi:hypothetical protein
MFLLQQLLDNNKTLPISVPNDDASRRNSPGPSGLAKPDDPVASRTDRLRRSANRKPARFVKLSKPTPNLPPSEGDLQLFLDAVLKTKQTSTPTPPEHLPTVPEVCKKFGLTDVDLVYTDDDFRNLTTYKLFQENYRKRFQAVNPKVCCRSFFFLIVII